MNSSTRNLTLFPTLLLLLLACAAPPRPTGECATARFAVHADFDGGQMGTCRVEGETIRLLFQPEDTPPINDSPWYAFRLDPSRPGSARLVLEYDDGRHRYWPKTSTDGIHWRRLDDVQVSIAEDRSTATLEIPLGRDPVWVSAQELITPEVVDRWLGSAAGRVGAAVDRLGLSSGGRPIHYVDTAPAADEVLLLVGRQHPPEVTGSLALEPFVDTLFADEDLARDFRRRFSVIAVPLMNPDGVVDGHWRHNLGGIDLNRDWGPFTQPETRLIRDLVDQLEAEGRKVRVFLDFHSTQRNLFYTQSDDDPTNPPGFTERWLDAARPQVVEDYPFTQEKRPHDGRPTSKNYLYGRFGIPSITYEMGDEASRAGIRQSAGVFARELMRLMLSVPGDQWDAPYYDLRIDNGLVYDGSASEPRVQSLALRAGRIVSTQPDPRIPARRVIDAAGLAVMPGFIDPHTHALEDLKSEERRANLNYLTQGVSTVFVGNDGRGIPDRDQTLRVLALRGTGTHVAFLAGHNTIRKEVMGLAGRAPTRDELNAMRVGVARAMLDGAYGLSTGLFYAPGSYADTDEVVALAEVAARHGGVYDTHLRSESRHGIGLMAALDEALEIGRRARIPVHVSHIKALGTDAWGMSADLIARIEQARADGIEVTANQYPWHASGTRFSNALIPRRLMADSRQAMRERLRDPQIRSEVRDEMLANLKLRGGPEAMLVTGAESPYLGMTLTEISEQLEMPPLDAAIEMVLAGDPPIASFVMHADDIHALAVQPWVMTGSDGSRGHPRKYATYPEAYRDLVLDNELLTTAQWVHRSSGLVADTFGLCQRGYLRPGYHADIAIIDLQSYRPAASYQKATELTPGVQHLLIGGVAAIADGERSSALPGRILRRSQTASECASSNK